MNTRIDIVRLRKRAGMNQRELANLLQVRPSFLSAIENGRSRLPEEKMMKLKEIFELDSFDDFIIPHEDDITENIPPHTHADAGDSLTKLLTHIHSLAHQQENSSHDADLISRIDYLSKRNDRLSDKIDELRDEIDSLRSENLQLKEMLIRNGIKF